MIVPTQALELFTRKTGIVPSALVQGYEAWLERVNIDLASRRLSGVFISPQAMFWVSCFLYQDGVGLIWEDWRMEAVFLVYMERNPDALRADSRRETPLTIAARFMFGFMNYYQDRRVAANLPDIIRAVRDEVGNILGTYPIEATRPVELSTPPNAPSLAADDPGRASPALPIQAITLFSQKTGIAPARLSGLFETWLSNLRSQISRGRRSVSEGAMFWVAYFLAQRGALLIWNDVRVHDPLVEYLIENPSEPEPAQDDLTTAINFLMRFLRFFDRVIGEREIPDMRGSFTSMVYREIQRVWPENSGDSFARGAPVTPPYFIGGGVPPADNLSVDWPERAFAERYEGTFTEQAGISIAEGVIRGLDRGVSAQELARIASEVGEPLEFKSARYMNLPYEPLKAISQKMRIIGNSEFALEVAKIRLLEWIERLQTDELKKDTKINTWVVTYLLGYLALQGVPMPWSDKRVHDLLLMDTFLPLGEAILGPSKVPGERAYRFLKGFWETYHGLQAAYWDDLKYLPFWVIPATLQEFYQSFTGEYTLEKPADPPAERGKHQIEIHPLDDSNLSYRKRRNS